MQRVNFDLLLSFSVCAVRPSYLITIPSLKPMLHVVSKIWPHSNHAWVDEWADAPFPLKEDNGSIEKAIYEESGPYLKVYEKNGSI